MKTTYSIKQSPVEAMKFKKTEMQVWIIGNGGPMHEEHIVHGGNNNGETRGSKLKNNSKGEREISKK